MRTLSSSLRPESVVSAIFNTKLLLKLKQYINEFRTYECACADRSRQERDPMDAQTAEPDLNE